MPVSLHKCDAYMPLGRRMQIAMLGFEHTPITLTRSSWHSASRYTMWNCASTACTSARACDHEHAARGYRFESATRNLLRCQDATTHFLRPQVPQATRQHWIHTVINQKMNANWVYRQEYTTRAPNRVPQRVEPPPFKKCVMNFMMNFVMNFVMELCFSVGFPRKMQNR